MKLLMLALAVIAVPAFLFLRASRLGWPMRYLLAVVPAAYTGIGWLLGTWAYDYADCQGGVKNLHACLVGNVDVTVWGGYGQFLMIPFLFVGAPISLWFLIDTAAKHIGQRHNRTELDEQSSPAYEAH